MAIIKSLGIEAVVLIKGEKAQEYAYKGTCDPGSIACYIASIDDAEYSIRFLVSDEDTYEDDQNGLGIKVIIDGITRMRLVWDMNRKEYMYLDGKRVEKEGGGMAVKPFKFAAMGIVDGTGDDEEKDLVEEQRKKTKSYGKIVVEVTPINSYMAVQNRVAKVGEENEEEPLTEIMLKANKGRQLTHVTGYGAEADFSKNAVVHKCRKLSKGPIARFVFMCRAQHVIEEYKKVAPISEDLPLPLRKALHPPRKEPKLDESLKQIKKESDTTGGDLYHATPQRLIQEPAQAASPAAPTAVSAPVGVLAMQTFLMSLNDEQKKQFAQLVGNVNNTAQNLETPHPMQATATPATSGSSLIKQEHQDNGIEQTAFNDTPVARDSVPLKQEGQDNDAKARLSINVSKRTPWLERQTNNGVQIDLTSPVEDAFTEPDPDANRQTAKEIEDTIMAEEAPVDVASENSVPATSRPGIVTGNDPADEATVSVLDVAAIQAQMSAVVDKYNKACEASMSPGDGIVTARTPEAPIQEPYFQLAEETQAYNADSVRVEKQSTPKELSIPMEVDIIASIEADRASSVAETIRQRKDSILSDVSVDLNAELQRARSDHPTVTSTSHISPTPAAKSMRSNINDADADFMVVSSGMCTREATEGAIVPTIDIDMTTGHDIVEQHDEEDDASPSRQLLGNFDNDNGFEVIYSPTRGAENTITGTPAVAAKVGNKPTEGFEAALLSDTAQTSNDLTRSAEGTTISTASVEVIETPIPFEEAMARAAANRKARSERATTPFPAVPAEVEVPTTPTQASENIALPSSHVQTGDDGFIDIETLNVVPENPVKHHSPLRLTKNVAITTPTHINAIPSTVEKLKCIEDLTLDPLRRSIFPKKRTPGARIDSGVGSAVTGNVHPMPKKTTPIKRELENEENDDVEVETPSKKMKYLSLGSAEKPISFDSDDESPDADIEPVQGAEVPHLEVANSADAEVTVEGARKAGDPQNQREKLFHHVKLHTIYE